MYDFCLKGVRLQNLRRKEPVNGAVLEHFGDFSEKMCSQK